MAAICEGLGFLGPRVYFTVLMFQIFGTHAKKKLLGSTNLLSFSFMLYNIFGYSIRRIGPVFEARELPFLDAHNIHTY